MNTSKLAARIETLQALESAHGCSLKLDFNALQAGEVRRLLPQAFHDAEMDGRYPSAETLFLAMLQSVTAGSDADSVTEGDRAASEGVLQEVGSSLRVRVPRSVRGEKKSKAKSKK